MHVNPKLSATLLFAMLVGVGYIGIQYFHPALFADRQKSGDAQVKQYIQESEKLIAQERNKPRFSGEINGIFLAPEGTPIPEKYTTYEDVCGDSGSFRVPDDQAGVFALDVDLPDEFVLDTESVNTGTFACDSGVTGSNKDYLYYWPNGDTGNVVIGRSISNYDTRSVATDRVRAQKIAGRDVVIIDTVTEEGYWDHAWAYFPESFGNTRISASSIPRSEFMRLVQLVASSTRTQ